MYSEIRNNDNLFFFFFFSLRIYSIEYDGRVYPGVLPKFAQRQSILIARTRNISFPPFSVD